MSHHDDLPPFMDPAEQQIFDELQALKKIPERPKHPLSQHDLSKLIGAADLLMSLGNVRLGLLLTEIHRALKPLREDRSDTGEGQP